MKVEELIKNQEHLKKLSGMPLPDMQLVWDFSVAYEEVEKVLEKFHRNRTQYLKDHGGPTEENQNPKGFDQKAFSEYLEKLMAVEVKIPFPKIPFEELRHHSVSISEMVSWKKLGIILPPEKKDSKTKKDEKK